MGGKSKGGETIPALFHNLPALHIRVATVCPFEIPLPLLSKATLNFPDLVPEPVDDELHSRLDGTYREDFSTSRYTGVCWHAGHKKWNAQIRVNCKLRGLGSFADEEDAAKAYDRAAWVVHGR